MCSSILPCLLADLLEFGLAADEGRDVREPRQPWAIECVRSSDFSVIPAETGWADLDEAWRIRHWAGWHGRGAHGCVRACGGCRVGMTVAVAMYGAVVQECPGEGGGC